MATQKLIKVGSSVAAIIPKTLLGSRSAGNPIKVERGAKPNTLVVRVLAPKKPAPLGSREKRVLALTDTFIKRYRTDLERLKDA